jgi:hypothetical protein
MKKIGETVSILVGLFICCIALYYILLSIDSRPIEKFTPQKQNIEMVIARYAEDMEWIKESPYNQFPYIVYNKGKTESYAKTDKFIKEIKLPNVGREAHTYLYHITENYDNLADLTIFLPGSIELEHKTESSTKLFNDMKDKNYKGSFMSCTMDESSVLDKEGEFYTSLYGASNKKNMSENGDINMKPSEHRPLKNWYEHHFGEKNKQYTCFSKNAIFAISKSTILDKPKSYYQSLIETVNDHQNNEDIHFFERTWNTVFYPYIDGISITRNDPK